MARKPSGVSSIGDRLPDTATDLFGREGSMVPARAIATEAGTKMSSITHSYRAV
jgi:hypothetical protein